MDSGSQLTTMGLSCAQELGLEIWPLETLGLGDLRVFGAGDNQPHLYGWTTLDLTIPKVSSFRDRRYPILVTTDSWQESPMHITLGTNVIRDLIGLSTESELSRADEAWNQAYYSCAYSSRISCAEPETEPFSFAMKSAHKVQIPPRTHQLVVCRGEIPTGFSGCALAEPVQPAEDAEINYHQGGPEPPPVFHHVQEGNRECSVYVVNNSLGPRWVKTGELLGHLVPASLQKDIKLDTDAQSDLSVEQVVISGRATILSNTLIPVPEELSPEHNPPIEMTEEERKKTLLEKVDLEGLKEASPELLKKAQDFFCEFNDIFSLHETDLGEAIPVKHSIKLEDSTPFKERFRRIPPQLLEEVKTELKNMLRIGVIKPSYSPWTNAVVLARKKGGELRMCIDFRKLNARTVKDAYPLPRIDEAIEHLAGSKWFSAIDLKSGFWHVPLDEDSKKYTAFTAGPLGFYEFQRMPFGLCNAPATFQRLMEHALRDINHKGCIIYIDDIVVFASSIEQLLERLRELFLRLRKAGMKMNPKKCDFFKKQLSYLGHIVSERGVEPDPKKIESVLNWPTPATPKEVKSFLGFAGYYRRFVKGFAKTALPLSQFTKGDFAQKSNQSITHLWTEDCDQAFKELKEAVTSYPVLAYADYTKPFRLVTDACGHGLGAALYQKQPDGTDRPVAFASTTLKGAEKNYPAHKLEFLALKWAVTEQFHDYLIGAEHFEVQTDNNPLTYVLTTAKLDACGHRWLSKLADYNFSLKYLKGSRNIVADALSRIDWHREHIPPPLEKETEQLPKEAVKEVIHGSSMSPAERPDAIHVMTASQVVQGESIQPLTTGHTTDWNAEQMKDPVLKAFLEWISKSARKRGELKAALPKDDSDTAAFLCNQVHLKTWTVSSEGETDAATGKPRKKLVLYRRMKLEGENMLLWQFVVPKAWRPRALKGCHDDAAHMGNYRTLELLQSRFWWPGMATECKAYCDKCLTCKKADAKAERAPLQPIHVTAPGDLYHVDYTKMTAPASSKGKGPVNVLVITDHFTRFAQAYITPTQSAPAAAGAVYTHCNLFGVPARIITDQGANFTSSLMQELCRLMGVKKLRTSPAHPQTNGQAERFNRTLFTMIRKLEPLERESWDQHLTRLVSAYNNTRSSATGYSPYFLFFGRRPRLDLDRTFPTKAAQPTDKEGPSHHIRYVSELKRMMDWANRIATRTAESEMKRQKRYYDRRVRATVLSPGDKVLVRQELPRSQFKLIPRWQDHIFTVEKQLTPGAPVYVVKRDDNGKTTVKHRNKLFPILHAEDQVGETGETVKASEHTGERDAQASSAGTEQIVPETDQKDPEPGTSKSWKDAASARLLQLARVLPFVGKPEVSSQ